jgi:hypothetical protein
MKKANNKSATEAQRRGSKKYEKKKGMGHEPASDLRPQRSW